MGASIFILAELRSAMAEVSGGDAGFRPATYCPRKENGRLRFAPEPAIENRRSLALRLAYDCEGTGGL